MREWTYWDWLGYGMLFIAAAILAIDTAMHLLPNMTPYIPHSAIWGFAPFTLLLAATVVLLARALGLIGSHSTAKAAPAAEPVTASVPVIKTAEADIPKKLAAIDAMREILNTDMPPWLNKGHQLTTGGWWEMALNKKAGRLRTEITAWRDAAGVINGKIESLRQQNDHFPDIHALSSQAFRDAFIPNYEHFIGAIFTLPDDPTVMGTGALQFFVAPIANEAQAGLQIVERWRSETDRKAI